jgi:hypothetical protein
MDKAEITNLQQQSVAQITERLVSLSRDDLVELAAQEAANDPPRVTLQAAIDKQLAALDDNGEGDEKKPPAVDGAAVEPVAKAAGKIDKTEKIPATDYRHENYSGPLSGEQADWRMHNIKPVEKVRTK